MLRDDALTEQERETEAELYAELLALRDRAQSTGAAAPPPERLPVPWRDSIWHFPDGQAVRVVCSEAPHPPPHADPSHLNYSRYARHADIDALLEVHGQVRADNLPTARETEETEETYVFKCSVGEETREFSSLLLDDGTLQEDVGLIARRPHLIIPEQTVTMIFGITSRGVHGAALALIDSHVRDANEQYLKDAFGSTDAFCVVMRVPVRNNLALPPNLRDDNVRLYEWSAETGARW